MTRTISGRTPLIGEPSYRRGDVTTGGGFLLLEEAEPSPGSAGEIRCLLDGVADETEVARAWLERGEHALAEIEGRFSLLVWNRRTGSGVIARDPLGEAAVHFVEQRREILFAPEIADLEALLGHRPDPDETAMASWLSGMVRANGSTLLRGVQKLEAGELIRFGLGGPVVERWWRPKFRGSAKLSRTEAAERLRTAMDAAVDRAAGPHREPSELGLRLSGGFDSLAIAAVARRRGIAPRAYSVGFPALPIVDETARIESVRAGLGLAGITMPFDPGAGPLAAARAYIERWRVPPRTPNSFVWKPLFEQAREDGIATMLDGDGGDELFGYSGPLIADRLRAGRISDATRLARRIPGMGANPSPAMLRWALRELGLRPAIPAGIHYGLRRLRRRHPTPSQPWLTTRAMRIARAVEDPDRAKRGDGPLWWRAKLDATTIGANLLGVEDERRRVGAMSGIRFAQPWRDLRLIESVLELPPELDFDAETDRPLARSAIADATPGHLLRPAPKARFNAVLEAGLIGELPELRRLLLESPRPEIAPLVVPEQVERLLSAARREIEWPLSVWRLGSLALWLEMREQTAPG